VAALVLEFARRHANLHRGITALEPDLLQHLQECSFDGNVRELENVVQRMLFNKGDGQSLSHADWLYQQGPSRRGRIMRTTRLRRPRICCGRHVAAARAFFSELLRRLEDKLLQKALQVEGKTAVRSPACCTPASGRCTTRSTPSGTRGATVRIADAICCRFLQPLLSAAAENLITLGLRLARNSTHVGWRVKLRCRHGGHMNSGEAQIGDRVSFRIADVFLPEPAEVLANLTPDVEANWRGGGVFGFGQQPTCLCAGADLGVPVGVAPSHGVDGSELNGEDSPMSNVTWQFQATIPGGPTLITSQPPIEVQAYDVATATIAAGTTTTGVDVVVAPPSTAGDIVLVVVNSDVSMRGFTYTVDGGRR
jgi:hypothetical protein